MEDDDYHADPCIEPSLSSTFANDILESTEIEAMLNQRRLNPEYEDKKSDAMDLGTMAHELILQGKLDAFVVCDEFDAWRSDAAKAKKKEIEDAGKIALNSNTKSILDDVKAMKNRLYEQLKDHQEYSSILQVGRPEQCGFAKVGNIWQRAKFDWIDETIPDLIVDYKTTGLSFDQWEKNQLWDGKYLQNPHYRRTYDAITGKKSKFIFVVQRTKAPFLVKIFALDDSYSENIEMRYEMARRRFEHCLKSGQWRGEPPYTAHSYPPPWVMQKWDFDVLSEEAEKSAAAQKQETIDPADALMAG